MNATSIFTKRILGLDNKVWMVMIVTCLICLGLFGYSIMDHGSCTPKIITINGQTAQGTNILNANQLLTFRISNIRPGSRITWKFSDQPDSTQEGEVAYKFAREEGFRVKAIVNDNCPNPEEIEVTIKRKASPVYRNVEIIGNAYPVEGAKEKFYCNIVEARSYLWIATIGKSVQTQNAQTALFTFPTSGTGTIELVLDNDPSTKVTREITVLQKSKTEPTGPIIPLFPNPQPKRKTPIDQPNPNPVPKDTTSRQPAPEPEAKPKKKEVHPETFRRELQDVWEYKKTPEELAERYLYYEGNTKVIVNDKKVFMFTRFCDEMRSYKRIKIESVSFQKDDYGIQVIHVKLDKFSFINWLLKKNKN